MDDVKEKDEIGVIGLSDELSVVRWVVGGVRRIVAMDNAGDEGDIHERLDSPIRFSPGWLDMTDCWHSHEAFVMVLINWNNFSDFKRVCWNKAKKFGKSGGWETSATPLQVLTRT